MPRRFNYTQRKKIAASDAAVTIRTAGPEIRFEAALNLAPYRLNAKARIFVEAYRAATAAWQRFDFGEVGSPASPMAGVLADFDTPDGVLFRVKVVAEKAGIGRLLAAADQLRPVAVDGDRSGCKSLLDTMTADLDGEGWRVDFSGPYPVLMVERKLGGKDYALTPEFRALAAPAVFRDVLTHYLLVDTEGYDPEETEEIAVRWTRFAEGCASRPFPGIEAELPDRIDWVRDAVSGFARRQKLIDAHLLTRTAEEARP